MERVDADTTLFWEQATDLFAICDAEGDILRVNPAWQRMLGWTSADLVGRNVFALTHPDDVEPVRTLVTRGDGRLTLVETRLRDAAGAYRPISWSSFTDGQRWYLAGCDVTEEASAQATLDALEAGVAVLGSRRPHRGDEPRLRHHPGPHGPHRPGLLRGLPRGR